MDELRRKTRERLAGFPRPTAATEDMFSACDKIQARFAWRETHTGPYGRRHGRRHVEAPDFEDGKVGETSTVQDRCVLLKRVRSSPARLRAARPARQPEAAVCRRVACTCDGDAES